MSNSYDVIVIGGGHNGLVNAAYLARAGKKVLVLERRYVLGGAACTEEVFPGFKFSVCSYVVSLLRPEIIRDLDLPRHGLEILPLDGTFTPMPNGDHLWRVNDHGKTHREIARHSNIDAEAYDEFGKAMQAMCRFVKPILSMVPPDPATLNPQRTDEAAFPRPALSGLDQRGQIQPGAVDDHERHRLSGSVVRDRCAESDDVGFRESSELFSECARRGQLTFCFIITWEKSTARFVRGDLPAAALARFPTRLRTRRARLGWKSAPRRRFHRSSLKMAKRKAWCWRAETKSMLTLFLRASIRGSRL